MIAYAPELSVNRRSSTLSRLRGDLCGPYACDDIDPGFIRCHLHMAHVDVAVDIPAAVLESHRMLGTGEAVVLRIPSQDIPVVTTQQHKTAGWVAEMEDFDRF